MMELTRITFHFKDRETGKKKNLVLVAKELGFWIYCCLMQSDYLIPHEPDDVLGKGYRGLIQGFFSRKKMAEQLARQKLAAMEKKIVPQS